MHNKLTTKPSLGDPLLAFKLSAEGMSVPAQRDLLEYWGRRKFEGRDKDWT